MTRLRSFFFGAVLGSAVMVVGFPIARQYRNADGVNVSQGVVIEFQDQAVSISNPLGVMTTPFSRSGNGDPLIFDGITSTPKQFAVNKPADARAYRFVNGCDEDVRVKRVGSMYETVTATTGTRYLARTSEVMGTSNPQFISVMAMREPSEPCTVELQYGNGS